MKTIEIDLNSNPEIKDLVADMEPGDKVDLHTSIKAVDDQTLVLTIDEAEKGTDDKENEDDENENSDAQDDSNISPPSSTLP